MGKWPVTASCNVIAANIDKATFHTTCAIELTLDRRYSMNIIQSVFLLLSQYEICINTLKSFMYCSVPHPNPEIISSNLSALMGIIITTACFYGCVIVELLLWFQYCDARNKMISFRLLLGLFDLEAML